MKKLLTLTELNRYKPILYIATIILTIFLCITVLRPLMAEIYWFYGYNEIKRDNWDRAIKVYGLALKWDKYKGGLYYDMGRVYMEKKLYWYALLYIKESEKYIDYPSIPLNLAVIYLNLGDWSNAVIELKRTIAYQNNEAMIPSLYNELGNVYLRLEEYGLADEAFKMSRSYK